MQKILKKIHSNIQVYQTLVLSFILFIGVYFYKINISLVEICITFFLVIGLDFFFRNRKTLLKKNVSTLQFPYSGINAGFGICFFLRSDELILYILAACIAICSKYFIQADGKHFLNPSNVGVFVLLVLFPQYTWVNPLQWGNYSGLSGIYILSFIGVICLGLFMCFMVYKTFRFQYIYDYILPFLVTHFILFFIIPYSENWSSFFVFFNTSFMVFTFFMITDPKTIPLKSINRGLYAISIVLWFYVLQFVINENYAILGSLFVATVTLPFIWKYEQKHSNIGNKGLFVLGGVLLGQVGLIGLGLYYIGPPDLTFNNVCNQLFCRDIW